MLDRKYSVFAPMILAAIFALCSASYSMTGEAASAKYPQRKTASVDEVIFQMKIRLALTDKQGEQIRPAIEQDAEESAKIIKDNRGSMEAMKSAMEDLRARINRKLEQYLTQRQMKELEAMEKAQEDQVSRNASTEGRGHGGRKMFGRGAF